MLDAAPVPAMQHCVWMNAGLLRYRLCDRAFDCEHCLLDAALRGECPARADLSGDGAGSSLWILPEDRLYSPGHAWLRASGADGRIWRLGLDAFATAIIGRANAIRWTDFGAELRTGETAFEIETGFGTIRFATPVQGRVVLRNEALRHTPARLSADPYEDGWILEIALTDRSGILDLLPPEAARARIGYDWTHFRRSLALHLLAGGGNGCAPPQPGLPTTDVRFILGPPEYLHLLREFIH